MADLLIYMLPLILKLSGYQAFGSTTILDYLCSFLTYALDRNSLELIIRWQVQDRFKGVVPNQILPHSRARLTPVSTWNCPGNIDTQGMAIQYSTDTSSALHTCVFITSNPLDELFHSGGSSQGTSLSIILDRQQEIPAPLCERLEKLYTLEGFQAMWRNSAIKHLPGEVSREEMLYRLISWLSDLFPYIQSERCWKLLSDILAEKEEDSFSQIIGWLDRGDSYSVRRKLMRETLAPSYDILGREVRG
jgi:hypothetical protein